MTPGQFERARNGAPSALSLAPLYGALAKSQAQFKNVVKVKTGHGFKYADIGAVLDMALPILSANGIAVLQPFTPDEIVTIIAHESGASLEYRTPIVADSTGRMNASQKVGASVTYFRRYHLCSVLGIATEDEMDARLRDRNAPTEDFRDAREPGLMTGVKGAKVDHKASPAEKARAYADAIIAGFREAKTEKGVNGVWTRNEAVIERLAASYEAEHGDVLEAFTARMRDLGDEEDAHALPPISDLAGAP